MARVMEGCQTVGIKLLFLWVMVQLEVIGKVRLRVKCFH